jgi:hypothetical protein
VAPAAKYSTHIPSGWGHSILGEQFLNRDVAPKSQQRGILDRGRVAKLFLGDFARTENLLTRLGRFVREIVGQTGSDQLPNALPMTRWPVSIDHSIVAHLGYARFGFLVCPHAISEHEFPGIRYRKFVPSKSFSIPPKHSSPPLNLVASADVV